MKNIISTPKAPAAVGPYSQGVMANGFLFVSGQIPLDPATGEVLEGSISERAILVLENIGEVLAAAQLTYEDVVKTTIFLTDIGDFAAVNEVYAQYFKKKMPARSCVQVAALPKGLNIEIEVIAAGKSEK